MSATEKKAKLLAKRKKRVRSKINGTAERPRLSIFRSAQHIYAQVIDDDAGKTLLSISSFAKGEKGVRANVNRCTELGKSLAEKCKSEKINKIVFDRNGNLYHGRIKAFAEGAREGGLQF